MEIFINFREETFEFHLITCWRKMAKTVPDPSDSEPQPKKSASLRTGPLTHFSSSSSIKPLESLSRIEKTFFTSWGLFLERPHSWKNFLGQKESGAGGTERETERASRVRDSTKDG